MKKTLALILTLALSLAALTGCGSKTETPADTNTDSSAQTEAPAALSGSVSTNGSTSMEKVIGALSEQFMADNSGVTVTYDPTGSGAGIEAASNGSADIGLASRALKDEDIATLIERALEAPQGLNGKFSADEDTVKTICTLAAGDARSALTTLELASEIAVTRPDTEGTPAPAAGERYPITVDDAKIANPRRGFSYDKNGDMHFDIISAFIKSMRGSDPDATIYWLARMIDAGEDPKFIARRIMIQASEDVGNADPQALLVAHAAFTSAEVIGYPECRINLAQAALYVCLAPKSNACEASIDAALADIHSSGLREVPGYLRDRHRPGSDEYGVYKYPHDYPEGWVDQRYLPEGLERGAFWQPAGRGWEEWRVEQSERDRSGSAPK